MKRPEGRAGLRDGCLAIGLMIDRDAVVVNLRYCIDTTPKVASVRETSPRMEGFDISSHLPILLQRARKNFFLAGHWIRQTLVVGDRVQLTRQFQ